MAITKPNAIDNHVHQVGRNFTWESLLEQDGAGVDQTTVLHLGQAVIDTSRDFTGGGVSGVGYWNRVKIRHAFLAPGANNTLAGALAGWRVYLGPTIQSTGISVSPTGAHHFDFTKDRSEGAFVSLESNYAGNILVQALPGTNNGEFLHILFDCRLYHEEE